MVNHLLAVVGFLFIFFIPGVLIIEAFFKKLEPLEKIPLYIILSVLFSTYVVYFVASLFKLNRFYVLFAMSIFLPLVFLIDIKKPKLTFFKEHTFIWVVSILSLGIVFFALYPAIFTVYNNYVVLSAVNWQDTAMHIGIIESIAEGNFPPQAPYYAGKLMTYYYFSDFHSAIINVLKSEFFPRVLVYTNPIFIFTFAFSIYSFSYLLFKDKVAAIISSVIGAFFSNWIYIKFITDVNAQLGQRPIFIAIIDLLYRGYSIESNGLYQMAPMVDYFLQNRPMMVGLPSVAIIAYVLSTGYEKKDYKRVLLAGVVTALVSKFQFFAFIVGFILFGLVNLLFFSIKGLRKNIELLIVFILPILIISPMFLGTKTNGNSLINLVEETFRFGNWNSDRSFHWHLSFILNNFGLPFVIFLIAPVKVVLAKDFKNKHFWYLFFFGLILFIIPYSVTFTIYEKDMFKFFYFMIIPVAVITGWVLSDLVKQKRILGQAVSIVVILTTISSSFLVVLWSVINKNQAYTLPEYEAGIWMRQQTPQKSVYVGLPTVHSPITQVAGRLRILSYINWPHSHGYNSGEDNVFVRSEEIEKFYSNPDNKAYLDLLKSKYSFDYIYYGNAEKREYPEAEANFDNSPYMRNVYTNEEVKIYEVF